MSLSSGSVANIFRDNKPREPVVQLISIKGAPFDTTAEPPKRIKAEISDGEQYGVAVLTSEPAMLVFNGDIKLNQLITLKEYTATALPGTTSKVCIVMKADIAASDSGELTKIGEPVKWETVPATASPEPARSVSATKGGSAANISSPATSQASSRVAPSYAAAMRPPQQTSPLVASKATPIDALNPYSNKWLIKARVLNKTDLRTWNSSQGPSSVFSFDLCDDSGEIRVTAWREVADRLFPQVEVGKTYLLSRGMLKVANKKFSTLNNNYEITLNLDSQMQVCEDELMTKPKIHYRFISISDIASRPASATVDVIGVVSNISAAQSITSQKTGRELTKRTVQIADDSGSAIELTIWGQAATNFPESAESQVIAFKGLRVTEWNQRSLGWGQGSSFEMEPELEATDRLKAWSTAGGLSTTVSLSQDVRGNGSGPTRNNDARMTTTELIEKGEATSDQEYGSVRGYVLKHLGGSATDEKSPWFSSCPKCNKKVIGDEMSGFSCENCGWSGAECSYRYILPLVLVDGESTMIATAFNDQATALLGKKADEMKRLKDLDHSGYEAIFANAQWKPHVFRMRAKMETYQGKSRMKTAILQATPVNYATEGALLLKDIAMYDLPPVSAPDVSSAKVEDAVKKESVHEEPVKTEEMETGGDAPMFEQFA